MVHRGPSKPCDPNHRFATSTVCEQAREAHTPFLRNLRQALSTGSKSLEIIAFLAVRTRYAKAGKAREQNKKNILWFTGNLQSPYENHRFAAPAGCEQAREARTHFLRNLRRALSSGAKPLENIAFLAARTRVAKAGKARGQNKK